MTDLIQNYTKAELQHSIHSRRCPWDCRPWGSVMQRSWVRGEHPGWVSTVGSILGELCCGFQWGCQKFLPMRQSSKDELTLFYFGLAACRILVSRSGIEPESLLHWKVDSLQLYYQGSPLKLHLNIYVPFKEKLKGISRHRHLLQSLGYDSGKSYSCFKN